MKSNRLEYRVAPLGAPPELAWAAADGPTTACLIAQAIADSQDIQMVVWYRNSERARTAPRIIGKGA